MGCINSKKELNDTNPNIFRVVNVDDDGVDLWSGQLGITRTELTLYRKGREPTRWPLACLRRYGYDADLFTFESGRRCTTGEGIYAFRCRRAEALFQTLRNYIQLPIATADEATSHDSFPVPLTSNGPLVMPRNRASIQNSMSGNATSGTYVINNRPTSQSLSPSGTIQSNSNRSRSSDTINGESNYLQPTPNRPPPMSRFNAGLRLGSVSSGPLSPDPHSPGSPNSITNILEVTPLNPLPVANPGISNVYQEFPIRENSQNHISAIAQSSSLNNNILISAKKLSLDIPPQEPAPSVTNTKSSSSKITNNGSIVDAETIKNPPMSPGGLAHSDSMDNSHMYMNVTPGEYVNTIQMKQLPTGGSDTPQLVQTPTTSATMFGLSRMNSTFSTDPNRCYENLEPRELRPMLLRTRFSKPDIFAKVDLPSDKSEPSTPTNRRCNYIVLDLDQTSSSQPTNIPNSFNMSSCATATALNTSSTSTSFSTSTANTMNGPVPSGTSHPSGFGISTSMGLLPPDSPKKGVLDYATIDFNKTVALSNSTTPSSELDSEGSRQTRHSSTVLLGKHSTSISD